ncbi:hypothetical protein HanXRQr2_Chr09g0392021 [Helianthus annuus]|uniref:Uncharacterized protein n=1 Tax=Helianthus annuus TaxID=4232 RepID=A0A9K3I6T0_HELAN|nr:hypothetical protein HanXRQr2_Chr09g0392021 [Helianthus annuus]KAJ0526317.1 hypothetical protein HanHA300_Chr09g0321781 [Helianthus annuus]KAJ0534725.1 hypothetical protein HanIR_Chr09g0422901 [Helianthus annuus]KAJ0542708.1 hypothetical protein HanHA89_Chr09g0342731 [Helianthus annuus]KAJ0707768.1 hypothetical protein HanLR1_Chr09g0322061 [Helianthus annuus]
MWERTLTVNGFSKVLSCISDLVLYKCTQKVYLLNKLSSFTVILAMAHLICISLGFCNDCLGELDILLVLNTSLLRVIKFKVRCIVSH